MITRLGRDNRGFTLLETLVAIGLLTAVTVCMMTLMVTMLTMYRDGSGGTSSNANTAIAVRRLTLSIEEGRSASVLDTFTEEGTTYGRKLQVAFPYYNSGTGSYVKTMNGYTATYYLSGETGAEASGTYLWRSVGANKNLLAKNVDSVRFTVTNSKLVRINLKGRDPEHGAVSPGYMQQSIKLRNS